MSDGDFRDSPPSDPEDGVRVRDVLASDDPDELDPELVARLAAWFGPPAPAAPVEEPEDPERAEARAARERAMAAVEPGLLDALVGRGERYGQVVTPTPPRLAAADIGRFELARWGVRSAFGERERDIPDEVVDALRQRTPQALLRDLHRPESFYGHVFFDQVDLGVDLAGVRARALVTETISAHYAVRMANEPIPRRLMREDRAGLRAILDAPWQDSKPRRPVPLTEVVDAATLLQQSVQDEEDA
jgi:hypothetical protein